MSRLSRERFSRKANHVKLRTDKYLSPTELAMSRSRKTNRDHAKKKQRPMVEDELLPQGRRLAIANQLEALITLFYHLYRRPLPRIF